MLDGQCPCNRSGTEHWQEGSPNANGAAIVAPTLGLFFLAKLLSTSGNLPQYKYKQRSNYILWQRLYNEREVDRSRSMVRQKTV
jgi:hypothetical protein